MMGCGGVGALKQPDSTWEGGNKGNSRPSGPGFVEVEIACLDLRLRAVKAS